jgi:hypothetical protein
MVEALEAPRPVQALQARAASVTRAAGVGGPVSAAWREATLTRAKELESLCAWVKTAEDRRPAAEILVQAIRHHIDAAREAATVADLKPRRRFHLLRYGPLRERAMSNLDAAEALLLDIAPVSYVLGTMPSVLQHVRSHLVRTDPRREEVERIARAIGIGLGDGPPPATPGTSEGTNARERIIERERGQIVVATRAASSAALREQVRLRSFRNVVLATTVVMASLAIGIAILGWLWPTLVPLCFAPQDSGSARVVCPTRQSAPFQTPPSGSQAQGKAATDIDDATAATVTPRDLMVVELVGLTAAAVAGAAAINGIRGSSERYGLPVALAALKLPLGAVTAFLGLLLMRGQFVPGLSALDTSAQILAWALVFGYAQQLFTRLIDRQGQVVLDSVRGADRPDARPS